MDEVQLSFTVDERTERRIINIQGALLLTNVEEVRKPFMDLVEKDAKEIVFNLADMKHIDSSGIALLLQIHRKMVAGGRFFFLAALNYQVKSIFVTAGLDKMVEIREAIG